MKWKLDGNADDNTVHVSQVKTLCLRNVTFLIFLQNAADSNSPLDCSPACPQPPPGPGHNCLLSIQLLSCHQLVFNSFQEKPKQQLPPLLGSSKEVKVEEEEEGRRRQEAELLAEGGLRR